MCYVAGYNSSLGSDLHPARLPTFDSQVLSRTDSFSLLFSPSFPTTLYPPPLAIFPQAPLQNGPALELELYHIGLQVPPHCVAFQDRGHGSHWLAAPTLPSNQEALLREQPGSYPSFVWPYSFQSDLACHSDYAFWLIFYEARLPGKSPGVLAVGPSPLNTANISETPMAGCFLPPALPSAPLC